MDSGMRKAGDMSDETLDMVLNQFEHLSKKYPNDKVRVGPQGLGEPLLDPRFFEVLSMIKERIPRAFIHVNTNGLLLNEENIERLVDSELNHIIVGMNECDADDYKNCRGANTFELVKTNIEMLLRAHVRRKKKRKPRIRIQLLNTCFNRPKLEKFINYWQRQGAKVSLKPYYPRPQWILQLLSDKNRENLYKYFGREQKEMKRNICRLHHNSHRVRYRFMVTEDGYTYPCIAGILFTPSFEICLGHISEISIEEAYNRKVPHIKRLLVNDMWNEIDACSKCIGAPIVLEDT